MSKKRKITIAEYIIKYGIGQLANKPITSGDYSGVIRLTESDLDFHQKDRFKERIGTSFERFHKKGNYRFQLVYIDPEDKRQRSVWVHKNDLVDDIEYIICVHKLCTPVLGDILTVHEQCHIIGKQGGVNRYKCDCCNEEFLGGTTGVGEWTELADPKEVNYMFCTDKYESIRWHLRQIRAMHHRYCQYWSSYDSNMKPIIDATCVTFGLAKNKYNWDHLLDAALLGNFHYSIQELIDKDTSRVYNK